MTGELVGRERELALVAGLLERTRQAPAGLVLVGEAGIGKTILWQQALKMAHDHGYQVLACRGVEAEARLSFAALGDLLADVLPAVIDVLTPPRRRALEVALLIADPGSRLPDVRAVALAFLDGLRALARSGPIVLAVDDIQWLDQASGGLLAFALRRLRDEPMGLLATFRLASDGDQASVPTGLEQLRFVEQARLGPLNLSATYQLLKARLGLSLTRPQLVRLHEATRGNPLFALEVARELQRSGRRGTPGQPLPVTADIRELLGRRLARLSARTREVLLAAAAAARPSRRLLAAVLDDPGRVRLALEEADGAGIFDLG
jgi:predicted ATPase